MKNIKWISGSTGIEGGHPRKLTAVVFCQDCGHPVAMADGMVRDERLVPEAGSSLTCEEVRELEKQGRFSLYENTWEEIQKQDCKWRCSNCSGYNVPDPIRPCEKCGEYSRIEKRQVRILPDVYVDLIKRQGKDKTLIKQGEGNWKEKAVVICGCGCQSENLEYLEIKEKINA